MLKITCDQCQIIADRGSGNKSIGNINVSRPLAIMENFVGIVGHVIIKSLNRKMLNKCPDFTGLSLITTAL